MNSLPVLIPDDDQERLLPVATCLSQVPGISLHVISECKYSPIRFSRYCASFQHCQYGGNEALWLEQIAQSVKRTGAKVIMPISTEGIEFASRFQTELKQLAALTFVPQRDAFEITINKHLFAQTLHAHSIPHPRTLLIKLDDAFEAQLAHFSFPVLIKPTFGGGGAGIHVFNDRETLFNFIQSHRDEVDGHYILQDYISGHDIDCSLLSHEGVILAFTVQRSIAKKMVFTPAPEIELIHDASVFRLATQLIQTLNWSGVAHIDMRYNEISEELEVIEINPRYWGSLLGSLAAGVNFPHLACLATLGQSFSLPEYSDTRYIGRAETIRQMWQTFQKFNLPTLKVSNYSQSSGDLQFLLNDPMPHLAKAITGKMLKKN